MNLLFLGTPHWGVCIGQAPTLLKHHSACFFFLCPPLAVFRFCGSVISTHHVLHMLICNAHIRSAPQGPGSQSQDVEV